MRIPWFASCLLAVAGIGCGGGDDGYTPPGDDDPRIDARLPPDADPNAPDAQPDAMGDGVAPEISVVQPTAGSLVAGDVTLIVDVTDTDGVTEVTASIGGRDPVALVHGAANRWSGVLDTLPLEGLVTPSISVRAVDGVGTENVHGFSVVLDNEPPFASLDPPQVRQVKFESDVMLCSQELDPVGYEAPDDGEAVPQLSELRARVADRANSGTLSTTLAIPMAGVATVDMYVLDDSTIPLVVDTDGDGMCDSINPQIVPAVTPTMSNEAALVALDAVSPQGEAFFAVETFGGSNGGCSSGAETEEPANLCNGEPGAKIAIDTAFDNLPQIYGIPAISEFNCLGFAFDAPASNISDGWACTAVLATDALGNHNVSPPLRICVDHDADGAECLPIGSIAAPGVRPNCTGTYDPGAGTVTNTPCTPETFVSFSTPDEFELIFP